MKEKKKLQHKTTSPPSDMDQLLKAKKNHLRKERWAKQLKKDHQIKKEDEN